MNIQLIAKSKLDDYLAWRGEHNLSNNEFMKNYGQWLKIYVLVEMDIKEQAV